MWIAFSFSALIAVAKPSKTMLNSSGESGHPCLVPDFRGNAFNFSPLRIMFAVGLSYRAFIMLRYVPSIPAFWRVFFFYHKWMLNFVKDFLCIYWDNHMAFIFQVVNVVNYIDWLVDIKESLHPWDKAHLVMVYDLFNMLLDSDCKNFVKDFCIYVHQWYWPVVFFLWHLCQLLGLGWWWPQNEFGSLLSSAIFWKSLSRICISSSRNFC